MPKGPLFVGGNAARHEARNRPWNEKCATVDVDKLRIQLSVEYVRARGGLTYEERIALKSKISLIQRRKERREVKMERQREKIITRIAI